MSKSIPSTKVLAIGRFTHPPTAEERKTYMPQEVPETLRLYLNGYIEQFWVRHDLTGPIFLMNVRTVEEAHAVLEELPLGKAGLMTFELILVGPLAPLGLLTGDFKFPGE